LPRTIATGRATLDAAAKRILKIGVQVHREARRMSRWKAFSIHLALSLAIGAAVFSLLYFVWYPGPLFTLTGGQKLTLLVIGVDVVIGPLLTLSVFKSGKPGLRFDLTVIGLLQATAMAYGLGVSLVGRPAYVVFEGQRFVVVHANAIDPDPARQAQKPEYRAPGFRGPRTVALVLPAGEAERGELSDLALTGHPLERMTNLYGPFEERTVEAAQAATDLAELHPASPRAQRKVDALLRSAADGERLGFVPLLDGANEGVVIVSRNDGHIIEMIDTPPK
jgi:hypothetical protein